MSDAYRPSLSESLNQFMGKLLFFLPDLLTMLTIFVAGFLIAWVIRILLLRFLRSIQLDRVSERWGITKALSIGGITYSPARLSVQFLYWIILVVTFIVGIDALHIPATQILITEFFRYIPSLFAALFILIIGYLLAHFFGQAAMITAVNAGIDSARLIARLARGFLLVLAFTMALFHLGIAAPVVLVAFTILFGGAVLTSAIAFGWAGRDLARRFLEKLAAEPQHGEEPPDQDRIAHI
jgi:hypothetical protein